MTSIRALCGLLLASKVWQDYASWNVEFSLIYPEFNLKAINKLEKEFIKEIQWDMYIKQSLYAKYYFALRAMAEDKRFRNRYNSTRIQPPEMPQGVRQRISDIAMLYSRSMER